MQITKKPYEISLWNDVLTQASENETISYYKERKLCTIGSNTMTSPVRAINAKLVEKINGENVLTFSMYSQYWDYELNKLIWNPFMQYLTNERKVKLKLDGKWYDFIIKNIDEDSATKCFTYTCKDLFINELAKTGFEIEFDNDLGNNMGTLPELAEEVLKGSDWRLQEQNDIIHQYIEEPLYKLTLSDPLTATCAFGKEGYDKEISIPGNSTIYIFYSSISNESDTVYFLYDHSNKQLTNDKNVFVDYSKSTPNGLYNCYTDSNKFNLSNAKFFSSYKGNKIVKSQKTWFDPKLNRTVKLYNDGNICGFQDTEYISASTVHSYVTNPSNFTSTSGWYVGKRDNDDASFSELSTETYPELTDKNFENYEGKSYLKFNASRAGQVLMNSGIQNSQASIKNFSEGETYIIDLIAYLDLENKTRTTTEDVTIRIFEYKLEDGVYISTRGDDKALDLFTVTREDASDRTVGRCVCTCKYSLSEEELKNTKIGIFIQADKKGIFYLEELLFYPKIMKENSDSEYYTPDTFIEPQIRTLYCYYEKQEEGSVKEEIKYLYREEVDSSNYIPYYGSSGTAYEKNRSIVAKESNRYNLLLSLSELFESWIQFTIEHDANGAISLDEEYRPKKWVSYQQYLQRDNSIGFKYGINLKSIKRTLDSNGTISKIIVKDNSNEFAIGGFCSITRAEENPSGENSLYSFDYYIGQGLLDFDSVNDDLYSSASGSLGYYNKLKTLNNEAQEKIEILAYLVNDIANYDSQYQTYKMSVEAAQQDKVSQEIKFRDLTGVEFSDALPEYQPYKPKKHRPDNYEDLEEWWKWEDLPWEFYELIDGKYEKYDGQPIYNNGNNNYYARLKWWNSENSNWSGYTEAKKIYNAIARDISVIQEHGRIADKQLELKQEAIEKETEIKNRLKEIKEEKVSINLSFYKKYSRFIQEGSWISEDYYDDNLYYIDALATLNASARPQVKYTIDVIELSQIDEYSGFNFALGDKTFVEDKEFFGWAYDGTKRLYREEVIISEVDTYLDSPELNKIIVQNYKTQFEDLFQRVMTTTQQIQFATGEYARAASIVKTDGTIDVTVLQNSFSNNAIILQNARDQSVVIGDDGITTTNLSNPSEVVRIVSGGIYLTENSGETWTTGISAKGINANCITTGSLNVSEVNISMGTQAAMRWDSLGISSFKRDENGIYPSTFTRFDQFGIYGINDKDAGYDPLEGVSTRKEAMQKLKQDASFGLTWDGFWLKTDGVDGYVSISSEKDFEVIRTNTNEETGEQIQIPIIQIGRLMAEDSNYYGIRINDLEGNSVLETNQNGELWLKQKLSVQTNDPSNTVEIGALGDDLDYSSAKMVINASDRFKVYEDGHVEGTNAHFSGGSTFSGTINATGGQIGGLTIEEWKEMGYSVKITSSNGTILKGESSTVLTATLYKGNTACLGNTTEMTDDNGKIKTYKINYQWKKNGVDVGDGTNQSLDVSLTEEDTTIVYECVITLTEVSNE